MITTKDMANFDNILTTASTQELNTLKEMIEKRQKDAREQEYRELVTKAFYAIKAVAGRFPTKNFDDAFTWEEIFENMYTDEVGKPDEFE
jgi:aminopeptidase C